MRLWLGLSLLLSLGCHGKPQNPTVVPVPQKPPLVVPAPPDGPSACAVKSEPKQVDQGLQTEKPIPAALVLLPGSFAIAWARTEIVESPELEEEEDPKKKRPSPEMGPIHFAKLTPGAKQANKLSRFTGERTDPRELALVSYSNSFGFFFEDETGVYFSQKTATGKATSNSFVMKNAHAPSLTPTSKAGGLWLSWASKCGVNGQLLLYKLPSKSPNPADAIPQPAPGLLCKGASTAMAASGKQLAVAWIVKGEKTDNNHLSLLLGDAEKSTFQEPISIRPSDNPLGGPSIAYSTDGKEIALAWVVEGGAIGFAILSATGETLVAPRLVPGSAGANDLAASIVVDPVYYGLSWSTGASVFFGLMDRKGEMPTTPLVLGPGIRPTIAKGPTSKDYNFLYWRPEDTLISSKALVFQQATCFAKTKSKAASAKKQSTSKPKTP